MYENFLIKQLKSKDSIPNRNSVFGDLVSQGYILMDSSQYEKYLEEEWFFEDCYMIEDDTLKKTCYFVPIKRIIEYEQAL